MPLLVSPYISITALNVDELNSPIKRHRVAGWMNKVRLNKTARDLLQL